MPSDATVENHGTISLVTPRTERASKWIEENVQDDAMFFGMALVVEHRYVADLVHGMVEDGLVVE